MSYHTTSDSRTTTGEVSIDDHDGGDTREGATMNGSDETTVRDHDGQHSAVFDLDAGDATNLLKSYQNNGIQPVDHEP